MSAEISSQWRGQYPELLCERQRQHGLTASTSMGADTLKRAGQQPVIFPGVAFIQEINLQRASYGAEFGGPGPRSPASKPRPAGLPSTGACLFVRSQIFSANQYFNKLVGLDRGGERYNNYGYYIGGPVWFPSSPADATRAPSSSSSAQEYLRSEQSILQNISNIPTAAQRKPASSPRRCARE